MPAQVTVRVQLPGDLKQLRFPKALDRRLQHLLDKQSETGKLSTAEREEAEGLVELVEILSLLRLSVTPTKRRKPVRA